MYTNYNYLLDNLPTTHTNTCILWPFSVTQFGYGCVWVMGSQYLAHRVAYEHTYGPIPSGLELDHLCRIPACFNPHHLEAVTHLSNVQRGRNYRREMTHCLQGHEFTPSNTRIRADGIGRRCRICDHDREQNRDYKQEQNKRAIIGRED